MDYDVMMFAVYTLNGAGYDITFTAKYSDARIIVKNNNTIYEFDSVRELVDFAWAVL